MKKIGRPSRWPIKEKTWVDRALARRLDRVVAATGKPRSAVVRRALDLGLSLLGGEDEVLRPVCEICGRNVDGKESLCDVCANLERARSLEDLAFSLRRYLREQTLVHLGAIPARFRVGDPPSTLALAWSRSNVLVEWSPGDLQVVPIAYVQGV